jgi:hypothetical protein
MDARKVLQLRVRFLLDQLEARIEDEQARVRSRRWARRSFARVPKHLPDRRR